MSVAGADASLYVDMLNKLVTTVAIVVGGFWALWIFVISRAGQWNLQLTVSPCDLPYGEGLRLLQVGVGLKNVGKIKITPGRKGCTVAVRRFDRGLSLGASLHWEQGKPVIENVDILQVYRQQDGSYSEYEIEPGAEYRESLNVVVPEDTVLMIETTFWSNKKKPMKQQEQNASVEDDFDSIPDYCVFQTAKTQSYAS
jgi:hypothetical protein